MANPTKKTNIQIRDLNKIYQTPAGGFQALKEINLNINEGEFLGIIGKSGAGKTTLLNMISGVSKITSGKVLFYVNGKYKRNGHHGTISIHSLDENELALWRGQNLGIVYQSFELLPMLNLVDNVMIPQDFSGFYRPKISAERAMELLEIVEIAEHAYKVPAHISGGQKQRVAIARALVNDPPFIIADEPTGNLDTATAETIFNIFEKLVDGGKTVIMVTHDENLASRFSRRVYISDGEIVESTFSNKNKRPQQAALETGENWDAKEPIHPIETIEVLLPARATIQSPTESKNEGGSNTPPLLLRDVVKTYENAAGKFTALKGVNLTLNYGEFVSLVGKSGSGKSTLLNMVTGIDHPTSGSVIIGNEDIYRLTESQRALWRGRNVGIVFQFFQLLPTLTMLENVMLPMDYTKTYPTDQRHERAIKLLKLVGLEEHAHKLPATVSSGQQQSAAIARALANDPPIIMADEPTGNLDSRSAERIIQLFSDLAAGGKTILIVTHDPSITERTDRTVIISDGEFIDDMVAQTCL